MQILAAAEAVFAEKGFAAARLEDVAERVGVRRASLVYYFRDKQALYDAVLASVFEGLLDRLRHAVGIEAPWTDRIEGAVTAWVDYVGERPTVARLLLREVADATPERPPAVVDHARPILAAMERVIREGQSKGSSHSIPSTSPVPSLGRQCSSLPRRRCSDRTGPTTR